MDFHNKVAIVTSGSTDIGHATSEQLISRIRAITVALTTICQKDVAYKIRSQSRCVLNNLVSAAYFMFVAIFCLKTGEQLTRPPPYGSLID